MSNKVIILIIVSAMVNLVGALGPELSFDALWYHLTIPRIWFSEDKIFFIPGPRFYYSALPKLIDLFYVNDIWAKLIHWGFGILSLIVTYKIARKFADHFWSLIAALIFYSNLVVGWMSTTAYIDLGRTFFESLALLAALENRFWLVGIMLGLAISTKLLAVGSIAVFIILFPKKILQILIPAIIVPSPWLIFAWINTGNPIYPIFSGYDLVSVRSIWDFVTIWFRSPDPISPIYAMAFITPPFVPPLKLRGGQGMILGYCVLSLIIWWLTPRTGGGRFLLPYLPAFSVLVILVARSKVFLVFIVFITVINIMYRSVANAKYLPVILGLQSKQEFLDKYLDKSFSDNLYYSSDEQLWSKWH